MNLDRLNLAVMIALAALSLGVAGVVWMAVSVPVLRLAEEMP